MMYWLFREHNITPSQFYNMGEGEKRILRVFMIQEVEDIKKAQS